MSAFLATSLDGFIAREDGSLDWLQGSGESDEPPTDEDHGYRAFMTDIDAIVMGRDTYEKVRTFDAWPYEKPVVVLTHRDLEVPEELAGRVEAMAGPLAEVVAALAERGLRRLYVDGGRTIQGFLDAGLLDEITISRVPVLIGTGIPLFGPVRADIALRHVSTRTFEGGMVQSTYEVERP